ncbi:MAG TPA: amino acid adenylation domain-containing protein [Candidatus Sulfotelmatobacter sp.]|nr:amino acid adenylation domain-containing protein [Candidatus Sulfotelmatobacter sp.]
MSSHRRVQALTSILRNTPVTLYSASLAQRRLWFLNQLQGPTAAYNVPVGLWLYGPLDVPALRTSLAQIVDRHESLRTTFVLQNGELLQLVTPAIPVDLPITDFAHLAEPYPAAYDFARKQVEAPFDLSAGPLFRADLLRFSAEEHVLLCTMHHAITDAWSMKVFTNELAALYEAHASGRPADLPEIPIQYGDYAEWQIDTLGTEEAQQHLAYWQSKLKDSPPLLELPQDRPRPAEPTLRGATRSFPMAPEVVAGVASLAARFRATPFMLLLAAFKVLLYRYSGEPDVLVGIPVAGRNQVETESLIGFFVDTVVLRDNLAGNPRFVDLLAQVRETLLGALAHAEVPFEKVVEVLQPERNLSYNPIFQVMFSSIQSPVRSRDFGNLSVFPYVVDATTSMFDLNFTLVEWIGGKSWLQIDYNTDLFDASTIERMQEHFGNLLRGIIANPEQAIADLPLLNEKEKQQLVMEFNATSAELRHDLCLHELFEQQVRRTPQATAVIMCDERLSYHDLNRRADALADYLRRLGAGPDVLIGLCLDRSINLLVGILGILKAGAAYVPLDPAYPRQRLHQIITDSGLALLLTQANLRGEFASTGVRCIDLAADGTIDSTLDASAAKTVPAQPHNLAYVLFTSGSTGSPKGVALEHRNALNFVQWAQTVFSREELAGTLFGTSVCFDLSIFEIFVPWSVGGTVIVAASPLSLPELPTAGEVTLINTVPTAMAELLRSGSVPGSVLTVNLAGEALPSSLVKDLFDRTRVRNVYNLYGPTEACTYATYTRVNVGEDVTIGKPIANMRAYILDRELNLVPRGGRGELYLAGAGLARGYFGRPDLTAERFVPDPFSPQPNSRMYRTGDLCRQRLDGSIEYLGRLDQQVKLRGFRIELGEIEAVLAKHDSVQQAVVSLHETRGEKRLAAHVCSKPGRSVDFSELREYLAKSLPAYMIPDAFVALKEFPRLANGKVNRRALPIPDRRAMTRVVSPRDEVETTIARIWQNVLQIDRIGVTDNFFDLGGHSLLAARLVAEIQNQTGEKIPLSAIFRAPTVESLAALLRSDSASHPDPLLMQLHPGNAGIPFFTVAAPGVNPIGLGLLARHMGGDSPVYKLQGPGPAIFGRPYEKKELRALADEYIAAMRSVQPHGPYCLGGMCEGVLIAQEMILQLEAQGEEVAVFAIFDTWVLENSQVRMLWLVDYYLGRIRKFSQLPKAEQLATVQRVLDRVMRRHRSRQTGWGKAYWPDEMFSAPRFRAPVLLFKRARQPYYYVRDPQMGWGARSLGGVEICEMTCGHIEMLREPHVDIVGKRLSARLREIGQQAQAFPSNFRMPQAGVSLQDVISPGLTGPAL